VQKVAAERKEWDLMDTLLTDAKAACADRIKSEANLAPFLPPKFVQLALGMTDSRFNAESADVIMYQLMCEILPKWSNSTLAGVASFWYRYHWFLFTSEILHADMFDGDITLRFIRNVEITAGNVAACNSEKQSRQLDLNSACADSTRFNNSTAASPGVRKAMGFLNLHFGMPVLFPIDTAIMKCTKKKRSLPMQGATISVRAMMKIGHAAVHPESAIVRHVCCACYAMGLGAICLDQLNRICILGEHSPSGCLQCYTDLDKHGACHPCYIPVVGFNGRSWVDGLLSSTADVAIAAFLLKEDDSTNGDPFLASKFKRRPKRGHRVTKCVREILVMVCDVPRAQVSKFGISPFPKFMPTIAKLFKLEGDCRADVGR